jgi:hypothetical protein
MTDGKIIGGRFAPHALVPTERRELWVPPSLAAKRKGFSICDPSFARDHKCVVYRQLIRRKAGTQARPYGGMIHCPAWVDINETHGDNVREMLFNSATTLADEQTEGFDDEFLWQDSDEMQGTIDIQQWPELTYSMERWNRFLTGEFVKRDSPQIILDVG